MYHVGSSQFALPLKPRDCFFCFSKKSDWIKADPLRSKPVMVLGVDEWRKRLRLCEST